MSVQLEHFLLQTGLMSSQEVELSVEEAARGGRSLWDTLVRGDRIPEETLAETFSRWFNLPRLRTASAMVEPEAVRRIDRDTARRHLCLPVKIDGRSLVVAVANPLDYRAIQDIEFATGLSVRPLVSTRTEILDAIETRYNADARLARFLANVPDATELEIGPADRAAMDDGERGAEDLSPVVKLCTIIVRDGVQLRATEMLIEPEMNDVQVRLRVDGVLRDHTHLPKWLHTPIVARLKTLAGLDVSERKFPQDGRLAGWFQGRQIDIRLSTLPTHYGEKVVMRLLGTVGIPALGQVGLSAVQAAIVETALNQPQGLILAAGPAGSGRTTTLYSMLAARHDLKAVTVEDPIEHQLPGVTQVQVNAKQGVTFASVLRSALRQNPDTILVGEIRDRETADLAIHAAMTGRLVLAAVQANTALGTLGRLLELGVDPALVRSSISLVIAQRLARRVCARCRETYRPSSDVLERLHVDPDAVVFYRGRGCPACGETGYAGRVGLFEVMRLTLPVKELVGRRATEADLRAAAAASGVRFLMDEALRQVILGHTTAEEVLRVVGPQEDEHGGLHTCPKCLSTIEPAFSACPYCLYSLKGVCSFCGQELRLEWKGCPYCNSRVPTSRLTPSSIDEVRWTEAAAVAAATGVLPMQPMRSVPVVPRGLLVAAPDVFRLHELRGVAVQAPRPEKTLRVLAVNDDPEMEQLILDALRDLPFDMEVSAASDGEEALRLAAQAVPDVVILDLKMPRVDGFTVCRRLRESLRTAFVPVMALTASADDTARMKRLLVGTDDYITKPFSVPDLHARVTRMLRRTYGL